MQGTLAMQVTDFRHAFSMLDRLSFRDSPARRSCPNPQPLRAGKPQGAISAAAVELQKLYAKDFYFAHSRSAFHRLLQSAGFS